MTDIKEKKRIPLKEGFWTWGESGEKPRLIGSICEACGELFFPKKENSWCIHCQKRALKDTLLSTEGEIVSFSVVMQQPGGGFYKGPVPFAYGQVDLPEGLRLKTLFSFNDFKDLELGKKCELVIEKLYDDEGGNEIVTYKFRPKQERKF
ncbi:MAG: OB-fold domain-containing protein [Pseudomonadota bacterium]